MAITPGDLDTLAQKSGMFSICARQYFVAEIGTYIYIDPVTGNQKTATVSQAEKDACFARMSALLTDLKTFTDGLTP